MEAQIEDYVHDLSFKNQESPIISQRSGLQVRNLPSILYMIQAQSSTNSSKGGQYQENTNLQRQSSLYQTPEPYTSYLGKTFKFEPRRHHDGPSILRANVIGQASFNNAASVTCQMSEVEALDNFVDGVRVAVTLNAHLYWGQ